MKKIVYLIAICNLLFSCSVHQKDSNTQIGTLDKKEFSSSEVPYTLGKNYFVRNDFDNSKMEIGKITSQAEFESIFGMATTMGPEGKPTPVDFSKQYVITFINDVTDVMTTLSVNRLTLTKKGSQKELTLSMTETQGEKVSYSMQPFVIVIVDKKYDGTLAFEKIL